MSYCPRDGHEIQIPPEAPPQMLLICPQCLDPMRMVRTALGEPAPFFEPVDVNALPLRDRNAYEKARDQLVQQRLAKKDPYRKVVL